MKIFTTTILLCMISFFMMSSRKQSENHLKTCWEQQVKPLQGRFLSYSYQEDANLSYHSAEPWLTMNRKSHGRINCHVEGRYI